MVNNLWILSSMRSELKKDTICSELFSYGNSIETSELTLRKLIRKFARDANRRV